MNSYPPNHYAKRQRLLGLTVTEMLAVISVIGILLTLLLPTLGRSYEKGKITKCQNNLKQLYLMFSLYAGDHDGVLPPGYVPKVYKTVSWATEQVFEGTMSYGHSNVFMCPSDWRPSNPRVDKYSYGDGMRLMGRKFADFQSGGEKALLDEIWFWHGEHWYSEDKPIDVNHSDPDRERLYDGKTNQLLGDGSVHYRRVTLNKPVDIPPD